MVCTSKFLTLLATVASLVVTPARAEYPDRPIRYIVSIPSVLPFQREIAERMQLYLKEKIVLEVISGASGTTGMQAVVHAKPDGYTIGFGGTPNMVLSFKLDVSYDPMKDLTYIGLTSKFAPQILAVRKGGNWTTLETFMREIKKDPKKFTWGSSNQNSAYVNGKRFLAYIGAEEAVYVPFRTPNEAVGQLLGGHLDFVVEAGSFVGPQVGENGGLAGLAVLDNKRSRFFPTIPVPHEIGVVGDLRLDAMSAIVAPKGVPIEVISKLQKALYTALKDPELQAKFQILLNEVVMERPEEMTDSVRRWIVREKSVWDEVAHGN